MRSKNSGHYLTIVNYVNKYFDDIGRAPSTREIESGTGISRATVQRYLRELAERGEIEYDGHRGIVTDYMRSDSEGTSRVLMGNSIPCGTQPSDMSVLGATSPLSLCPSVVHMASLLPTAVS